MRIEISERDCWAWLAGGYSALWLVGWRKRAHRRKAEKTQPVEGQFGELRYSGPRWQWVVGPECIGLWHGEMRNVFGEPRTLLSIHPRAALAVFLGKAHADG